MGFAFHRLHTEPVITDPLSGITGIRSGAADLRSWRHGQRIHKFRETIWIEKRLFRFAPLLHQQGAGQPSIYKFTPCHNACDFAFSFLRLDLACRFIQEQLVHSRCALKVEHS